MQIEESEVLRYLGYQGQSPDERTRTLIHEISAQVASVTQPKHVWQRDTLHWEENGCCTFHGIRINSSLLKKRLGDCQEAVLFSATLGTEADRWQNRYSKLEIGKAAIWHAAATVALESYCTQAQREIASSFSDRKWYLRSGIAPGYGDFPLELQGRLLQLLDAGKRIGIVLTDGGLMQPEKSVIMLLGMSSTKEACMGRSCISCKNVECIYRRVSPVTHANAQA